MALMLHHRLTTKTHLLPDQRPARRKQISTNKLRRASLFQEHRLRSCWVIFGIHNSDYACH